MNLEKPKWPDGKKCAAMLTINLNAELFWLQIDPSCKDMPKTLSLGQYGMTRGVDRILSILKERGIKEITLLGLAFCGKRMKVSFE